MVAWGRGHRAMSIEHRAKSRGSLKVSPEGDMKINTLSNEKGAILITMLLLMVIVTLIGVIAINTATVDIQITGNTKRESVAMGAAEAGVDLSIPIIELTLASGQLTTSSSGVVYTIGSLANLDDGGTYDKDTTLIESEIFNDQSDAELKDFNTDVAISSFGSDQAGINIDIDRMYSYAIEGSSIEFAAGYEGIGAGAGGGGIGILYKINSQGVK